MYLPTSMGLPVHVLIPGAAPNNFFRPSEADGKPMLASYQQADRQAGIIRNAFTFILVLVVTELDVGLGS